MTTSVFYSGGIIRIIFMVTVKQCETMPEPKVNFIYCILLHRPHCETMPEPKNVFCGV